MSRRQLWTNIWSAAARRGLISFLPNVAGSIGPAGTPEGQRPFRFKLLISAKVVALNDALVAHSVMQHGIPVIRRDQRLLRFLVQIGYPAEPF